MRATRSLPLSVLTAVTVLVAACAGPQHAPTPASASDSSDLLPDERAALMAGGVDRQTLRCSARNRWSDTLRADAKTTADQILADLRAAGAVVAEEGRDSTRKALIDKLFWRLVLTQLIDGELNNLGAVVVADRFLPSGEPLLVLRTAFTAAPESQGSCVSSLIAAGVRHILNLYAGPMQTEGLEASEARAVIAASGTYTTARQHPELASFREEVREGDGPEARRVAMQAVANLIQTQILAPGGLPPRGHVQVHCGGGMHRTGMVIGVLQRCWNRAPRAQVAEHYKRHVGWRSDAEPGGFESGNLDFIEKFDCSLLRP